MNEKVTSRFLFMRLWQTYHDTQEWTQQ